MPIGQGEELYTGLRLLGKKAELVRYPGGFHIQRTPVPGGRLRQADSGLGRRSTTLAGKSGRAPDPRFRLDQTVSGAERLNASTLLDRNLEAGRAGQDRVADRRRRGHVRRARVADGGGRVVSRRPRRPARAAGADDPRRLAGVPGDVPRRDADRRGAGAGQPDGPGRQLRLLPRRQLRARCWWSRRRCCRRSRPSSSRGSACTCSSSTATRGRTRASTPSPASAPAPAAAAGGHPPRGHGVLALQLGLDRAAEGGRPRSSRHRRDRRAVRAATSCGSPTDDVCYSTTKLFHAYGLGNALTFPLSVGACAGLVKGRSVPDRIFEAVARYRPTLFFSVPALYAAMVKAPAAAEVDFSSVRACVSAAEALPAAVLARWQAITGVPILDGIGSTEMLHIYCSNTLSDLAPGTSGRPVPGYELRLVDERGLDVSPGEAGDLMVRGDSCAAYYWHQREKTRLQHARRLVPHRRPLHRRRRRPLRLPGPLGRHDQGGRAVGLAGRRRGLPGAPPGRVRGGGDRRPRSRTSAGSRRS